MSIMNFLEAVDFVLQSEMERRDELMILRPGARPTLGESEREIALPRLGTSSFSIALGAALTGMHPVLDLRQEEDPLPLLIDALSEMPSGVTPAMTILVDVADADDLLEFPGLRAFHPKNPRQAAGLLRSALRTGGMTLFVADIDLSDLTDEIPDDPDFMLLPLDETQDDETAKDAESSEEFPPESHEEAASAPDESILSAASNETAEASEAPVPSEDALNAPFCAGNPSAEPEPIKAAAAEPLPAAPIWAMRQAPFLPDRLNALTEELGAPDGLLAARCMERLTHQDAFCWLHDTDALPGECGFIPPTEKVACLWLGCDMLSLTYDAARLSHEEATALLRAARRLLENPSLLIYDKERDLP